MVGYLGGVWGKGGMGRNIRSGFKMGILRRSGVRFMGNKVCFGIGSGEWWIVLLFSLFCFIKLLCLLWVYLGDF